MTTYPCWYLLHNLLAIFVYLSWIPLRVYICSMIIYPYLNIYISCMTNSPCLYMLHELSSIFISLMTSCTKCIYPPRLPIHIYICSMITYTCLYVLHFYICSIITFSFFLCVCSMTTYQCLYVLHDYLSMFIYAPWFPLVRKAWLQSDIENPISII